MTKTNTKTKTKAPAAAPVQICETQMIPLNLLDVDEANVRTIKNGVTIEMLANDIALRSLLQSLNIRAIANDDGTPTGRYGVIAGGRRYKALQLLVKWGRMDKAQPIPCIINTGDNAADDSLAENVFREQLHPIDQFTAFKTLVDQGIPDADIAKRYHVTEKFVAQRMKLAKASPKLLKAFRDEEISLEQLQAFCVTDDHKRQDAILKLIKDGHHYYANGIRNALTEDSIEADDPRALYIGLDAYKAAGGAIMEDLFKDNAGPWLQNPDLLHTLATDKIEAVRTEILACGFKWAEVCLDPDNVYDLKRNLAAIPNLPSALTKEERAQEKALSAEYDQLAEKHDAEDETDPFNNEDQARLDEIEATLTEMHNRAPKLSGKQIARSGVIISIDHDGRLQIEYGFLKPEDVKENKKTAAKHADPDDPHHDADTDGYETDEDEDGDDTEYVRADNNPGAIVASKPLSDSLVRDLTSYRTVALQNEVAQDFNVAFLAALHALAASIFCHTSHSSCAKITPAQQYFRAVAGLEAFEAYKEIQERHQHWADRLPGQASALWNALSLLSNDERADLFAHCVSLTLDAVHGNQGRASSTLQADQLAEAVQLDMAAAGWTSTAENYFGRVNKEQIIDAVKEANPPKAAQIDHLKKPVMAAEAERIIKDTDWLPALLRAPYATPDQPETNVANPGEDADTPAAPLPEFLQGGLNGASSAPAA